MGETTGFRRGEDRDRTGLAVCDEVRALERIDGDVDAWDVVPIGAPAADALADVQHRRLVALALADDDPAGEVDLVHRLAHRLGGGLIGAIALAASHEPRRLDGGGLGDPDHLKSKQLLHQCLKCRRPVKTMAM